MIDTLMRFLEGWFALSVAASGLLMMLSFGFLILVGGGMLVWGIVAGLWGLIRRKP